MTQYYCAVFNFACGLQQVNLLSDTNTSVIIPLALCLKEKKKIFHWTKDWYQ
jgi:hypothetical protein